MKEYVIAEAFKYETMEGKKRVSISCIFQTMNKVQRLRKFYFDQKDAKEIFWSVINLDESGLNLVGKTLIVKESYALKVEEDEEEKGIYIEKTKEYEEFFKEANIIFNKNGNYINLVISKEKVRVEIIIKKDVWNIETKI